MELKAQIGEVNARANELEKQVFTNSRTIDYGDRYIYFLLK